MLQVRDIRSVNPVPDNTIRAFFLNDSRDCEEWNEHKRTEAYDNLKFVVAGLLVLILIHVE
jgi:hypothetical protein